MFVWCGYCQRLIGEKPPYFDTRISHSACARCIEALEDAPDARFVDPARTGFFRRLTAAALEGDLATCHGYVHEGLALGSPCGELAIASVHGVLYEVGELWERGEVTVADEHRATQWCETVLALLPREPAPPGALDLLGLVAPGNLHTLGARVAGYLLGRLGTRTQIIVPSLPWEEVETLVADRRPRGVAFSAALPDAVPQALEWCDRLAADGYGGELLVTGPAVRRTPGAWGDDPRIARTLWEVAERLTEPAAPTQAGAAPRSGPARHPAGTGERDGPR